MIVSASWARIDHPRRRIVLYASKLAAVAGLNPYVRADALASELSEAYICARAGRVPVSADAAAAAAIDSGMPSDARRVFDDAMRQIQDSGDDGAVAAAVSAASAIADNPDVAPEAAEAARMLMFTECGARCEAGVRQEAVRLTGTDIRTDARFRTTRSPVFSVHLSPDSLADVYLGGKHDGRLADDGRVVEIKKRMHRFLGVPAYERVQLHAYMAICGARKGVLVESYGGEQRRHDVEFDDPFFAQVLDAARACLDRCLEANR